jgi:hypothetical protein
MNPARLKFYTDKILPLEKILMQSSIAKYFSGQQLTMNNAKMTGLEIQPKRYTALEVAHLFMIPDGASIQDYVIRKRTSDGAPPGLYLQYEHAFVDPLHTNCVGTYTINSGKGLHVSGIQVDHVFWDEKLAPARLSTVAVGLMMVAAYKNDYDRVTLLAGGGAAQFAAEWSIPDMIGYFVWPKFGFDAPVEPSELVGNPQLANCTSVQEVITLDSAWWKNTGGNGRVMEFDLNHDRPAWTTLLDYMFDVHRRGELL